MKSYVMIFNDTFAKRDVITNALDEISPDSHWYCPNRTTIFFNSSSPAAEIAEAFEKKLGVPDGSLFLILEATRNKEGRLPFAAWHLLNKPNDPVPPELPQS